MKFTLLLLAMVCAFSSAARAEWKTASAVTVEKVRTEAAYASLLARCRALSGAGYMRHNAQPAVTALPPGWEAVAKDPRLHEYHYPMADAGVEGGKKEGWVILYDAEPERLAAWMANAVIETSPDQQTYSERRALALAKWIAEQSGAQFPVVGLVWEDMEGTGHPKAYGFLDGITVLGAPAAFYDHGNRTTAKLEEEALKQGLSVRWEGPAKAGMYARIASTRREQVSALYQKMGKEPPVTKGNKFAGYVRKSYLEAMGSMRNELLVATALNVP
jgi:hypothetical protein